MNYASGSAFRMALEERLRTESLSSGVPLARLRKMVAFDRLLARLLSGDPDAWVLKGGLALQLRFADRARTTKDVDLHTAVTAQRAVALLIECSLIDLGDFFSFAITPGATTGNPLRCAVVTRLDGRVFEQFHVDLGTESPSLGTGTCAPVTMLLGFADVPPVLFPCLPLAQHLAEKVHALTRPRGERDNSRVKDLVDIVLVLETSDVDAGELQTALAATFALTNAEIPRSLPRPPSGWESQYRAMAKELGLDADRLASGVSAADDFLIPVLQGRRVGTWEPALRRWREEDTR